MLGAVVLVEGDERLGQFGTHQREAGIIGKGGAENLDGARQVAVRLHDQALNEVGAVLRVRAAQRIAAEQFCREVLLARAGEMDQQLDALRFIDAFIFRDLLRAGRHGARRFGMGNGQQRNKRAGNGALADACCKADQGAMVGHVAVHSPLNAPEWLM